MGSLQRFALVVSIIGALNWGVFAIFRFDVVAQLAGGSSEMLARMIYVLILLAGLINLRLLGANLHESKNVAIHNTEKA